MGGEQPPRPDPLSVTTEAIPDELRSRDQWVCWRYEWDGDRDDWTKIPLDIGDGSYASSTDPETWTAFNDAVAYHERDDTDTDGVGFVVHDNDTILGLDFDNVRNPVTGDLETWAADVLNDVPTYAEASPSGTGLRLFGLGFVPDSGNRGDVDTGAGHIEMYDSGRYLTVTGQRVDGTPAKVRQVNDEIGNLHAEYIAEPEPEREAPKPAGDGGVRADSPNSNTPIDADKPGSSNLSDAEILEKAKDAKNGDKFRRLWSGDTSGYPSHSEADLALAGLLAFWTGGDREQIDRLFRQSGLYREKWDRDDYRERTIDEALAGRSEFYNPEHTQNDTEDSEWRHPSEEAPEWREVRTLYQNDSVDDGQARKLAVDILSRNEAFASMRDTEDLYRYNPETGIYEAGGEQYVGGILDKKLGDYYTTHERQEILSRLRDRNWIAREEFGGNRTDPRICVANGVLNLETGRLSPHSPEERFIRRIPVEFDPDAKCPNFESFLDDVVDKSEAKNLVYEVLGLAIHPGYITAGTLLLYGDGRNGKSTLLEVFEQFLGTENVSNRTLQELEYDDFAVADLYGKVANICGDLPSDKLTDTGMLKKLTGGDSVTANPKFKQPFTFQNEAVLIFSANDPPAVEDDSTAFYRRLLLLNFPSEFTPPGQPGPDQRPKHELMGEIAATTELSGLLNHAVEAARRLRETGKFSQQEAIDDIREQYKTVSDPVYAFASECLTDDSDGFVSTDDLYACYIAWCDENDAPKKAKNVLPQLLQEHVRMEKVRPRRNGKRVNGYSGIELTSRGEELLGSDEERRDDQQAGL